LHEQQHRCRRVRAELGVEPRQPLRTKAPGRIDRFVDRIEEDQPMGSEVERRLNES
jgi:hypothetical protein